jgi:uncharacterized protein YndB with AHSA1/START domain
MAGDLTAHASGVIKASPTEVWSALTDPEKVKEAFFGSTVTTDWKVGSPITWSGEWEGKAFEDKGEIVGFEPERLLRFTHFSPLTGEDDVPENYHYVTFELAPRDGGTELTISQSGVGSEEELKQTEANWAMSVEGVRKVAER